MGANRGITGTSLGGGARGNMPLSRTLDTAAVRVRAEEAKQKHVLLFGTLAYEALHRGKRRSFITDDQVWQIRDLYRGGVYPYEIAKALFPEHPQTKSFIGTIRAICLYQSRRDVRD